ncbi:MAG TPA: FtsH protease activity modulator HflK [Gammaproteobacteria bacterium]|nr:FtsH protease activity modulator HflK [Gammaproteobacteria bacterium]
MAWNEPGGGNRDPWGGRGGDQGPPDLDEIVRKLQDRFGRLFGGRRGGRGGGGPSGSASFGIGAVLVVALLVWLASGFYIVDQGKRGVVLRFGAYSSIAMPGPHWHLPYPVEQVKKVDVEQRRYVEVGYRTASGRANKMVPVPREALMLTQDENIVSVQIAVQYQVKDPRAYLFNVRDPQDTLKQVAESAVREVVGKNKMDFLLTKGRSEVVARTKKLMQSILDQYDTGQMVVNVTLQDAQPPDQVQAAFADAIKAREDEQRLKNEAQGYANDVIPKARGKAARALEEANGYKQRVIARSEGDTRRFLELLGEYEKAPKVTRKRMYLDTMQDVLSNSSKVTVDVKNGNNLLYLPIDKLMKERSSGASSAPEQTQSTSSSSDGSSQDNSRHTGRSAREAR